MEIRLRDFESMNLFSNKNLEKVISSIVNKSSNAVLINMFEDSLILLDHNTGQFYAADYNFDHEDLTLKIENFEPVELVREQDEFKDKIIEFFDEDEDITAQDLAESYKVDVLDQEKVIDELIQDAMITKDFSKLIDWGEIKLIKEDVEVADEKFFKIYKERLNTHPLMEVKLFDWETSVMVSLIETEPLKIVNSTVVEKANDLWKKEDFKEKFSEAASVFIEDVEEGTEYFREFLETYPQIFYLNNADRKALFGKSIISNNELKENMDILLKGIDLLFEKFDLAEMKKEYLAEAGAMNIDEPESSEEEEEEEEEKSEKKEPKEKKEKAPELSAEELKKLAKEIRNLSDKVEDEALKEKLNNIADKLDSGKEEGTRPDIVKEAVSILLM